MGLIEDVKYVFLGDKKNEENRSKLPYEEKYGWISVELFFLIKDADLQEVNREVRKYVEKLGWLWTKFYDTPVPESSSSQKVQSPTEDSSVIAQTIYGGVRTAPMSETGTFRSVSYGGEEYGPERLSKEKEALLDVSFQILKDIAYMGNEKKAKAQFKEKLQVSYLNGAKKEDSVFMYNQFGVLRFRYRLVDRLNLEKQNMPLAMQLFGRTAEEDLSEIGADKLTSETVKMKEEIETLFGLDLTSKKKATKEVLWTVSTVYFAGKPAPIGNPFDVLYSLIPPLGFFPVRESRKKG